MKHFGFLNKKAVTKMQTLLLVGVVIVAAAIGGFAYWYYGRTPPTPAVSEVKIGILLPLTGSLADVGTQSLLGYKLAQKEINEAGGIPSLDGAKINLVIVDDQGDPTIGATEAERLITMENVLAITGLYRSAVGMTVSQVCETYHTVVNVNGVSDDLLTRGFRYIFRTIPAAGFRTQKIAEMIKETKATVAPGLKTVGLVYDNTAKGISMGQGYKKWIANLTDLTVVVDEAYPSAPVDVSGIVLKLKQANPDVIIIDAYFDDALLFQRTLKEFDVKPKLLFNMESWNPSFGEQLVGMANCTLYQTSYAEDVDTPWNPGRGKQFASDFKGEYGRSASYTSSLMYTSMYVVADAIQRAGMKQGFADALKTDLGRARETYRDTFAETNILSAADFGFKGLVASDPAVKYDAVGQNMYATMLTGQYQNGKQFTVWPFNVTKTKLGYPFPGW